MATPAGWDFDVESMQKAPDGTFWFGDEFGPFLLHTDAQGRLLQAPVPTPGVKSPSNPTLDGATPDIANSKGFEGMAMSPDGSKLYPMLEGPVAEDSAAGLTADLRIFEVSLGRRGARFTGRFDRYRMEHPGNAIGDFIAVDDNRFLASSATTAPAPPRGSRRSSSSTGGTVTTTATSTRNCWSTSWPCPTRRTSVAGAPSSPSRS